MPLRPLVGVVYCELETSYTTPAGTHAFKAFNVKYEHIVDMTDRLDLYGNFMKFAPIPGKRMGKISFDFYLVGSGSAGTAPDFGDVLVACGLDEVVVGATSVTYLPKIAETSVASITYHMDGIRFAISNARGTLTIKGEAGRPLVASAVMTGQMVSPADISIVTPTFQTTVPYPFMGSTVTLMGVTTGVVRSMTWDLGNQIGMRDDINAASGYAGVWLSNQNTTGTAEIETPLVAGHDLWTKLTASTVGAVSHTAIGAAGNLVQIVNEDCYLTKLDQADADNIATTSVGWQSSTDGATTEGNNFQLIFT